MRAAVRPAGHRQAKGEWAAPRPAPVRGAARTVTFVSGRDGVCPATGPAPAFPSGGTPAPVVTGRAAGAP
ncbi:hypothetical protein GCM10010260_36740 [Streptomyces filipinensis]|uniref:Uncharacterized protein n=1 Tax=Streptomyces filipinensis TaxID=66887 RepID=A0A918IDE1_9ACTN|nr:hypothetical protein GCM10010260_36740 [Streptomyces filipinensis]